MEVILYISVQNQHSSKFLIDNYENHFHETIIFSNRKSQVNSTLTME